MFALKWLLLEWLSATTKNGGKERLATRVSVGHIDDDASLLGTVKLVEVNPLVVVHDQFAVFDDEDFRRSNEGGFRVVGRCGVGVDAI